MKNSTITVVVMTYNHVNYIAKALDSILCQEIDCDFDVLIHDDCSNDGTYELLLDYKKRYPKKIRIIHQDTRKFPADGFNKLIWKYVVPNIHSKYVAYCDGDDYWCDKYKLSRQFLFLESNSDYSMCFHSAYQLKKNGDMTSKWFIGDEGDINIGDIINDKPGICVATSSVFVKSEVFCNFPNWRLEYPVEDVPLYICAAINGRIHRLKEIMCVYRQFSSGSWSSQNQNNIQRQIKHHVNSKKALELFDVESNLEYHDLVISEIEWHLFSKALLEENYRFVFLRKNRRFIKRMNIKERLLIKIWYYFPWLKRFLKKN